MDSPGPSKTLRMALGSIVVFQMAYVVYRLVHHLYWSYYFPPQYLDGRKLPFSETVEWGWIAAWLVTIVVGFVLLLSLSKARAWVWIYILIILITCALFLVWGLLVAREIRYLDSQTAALLLPLSYGFFALWSSRRTFSIRMAHLIQLGVALAIASIVIFINAMYFHEGVTEWAEGTPAIVYFLGDCHFAHLQERTLILLWACYAGVSSMAWCLRRVWIRTTTNAL